MNIFEEILAETKIERIRNLSNVIQALKNLINQCNAPHVCVYLDRYQQELEEFEKMLRREIHG